MKKLLLVLLVVSLAAFLFVGCLPTTPTEGEGEGEGEGECEVAVVIDGAVIVDGKTYLARGTHTITVTFCAPVVGWVSGYITYCDGDYSEYNKQPILGGEVVFFPNADKTIWTASGEFNDSGSTCCASYVEIYAGECEGEACIKFPVIVDSDNPFAEIAIDVDDCECEGCTISFESTSINPDCAESTDCCGDYFTGIASWSMILYDGDPFDECCDPSICEEPIGSCSGTECSISCVTDCLSAGTYYSIITLVDAVGRETVYYSKIILSGDSSTENCDIDVYLGSYIGTPNCIIWNLDTSDTIGWCPIY